MTTYQRISWDELWARKDLMVKHHHELVLDPSIPFDLDHQKYRELDEMKMLFCYAAKQDDVIVGYYVAMLAPSMMSRNTLFCYTDFFYLIPELRGKTIGVRMFQKVEQELNELHVTHWLVSCKLHSGLDHSRMLKFLGMEMEEKVFIKNLKGE